MRVCNICINLGEDNFCYLNDKFIFNDTEAEFCDDYLTDEDMLNDKELRCELDILNKIDSEIIKESNLEESKISDNNDMNISYYRDVKSKELILSSNGEYVIDYSCQSCSNINVKKYCNVYKLTIKNTSITKCSHYSSKNIMQLSVNTLNSYNEKQKNVLPIPNLIEEFRICLIEFLIREVYDINRNDLEFIHSFNTFEELKRLINELEANNNIKELLKERNNYNKINNQKKYRTENNVSGIKHYSSNKVSDSSANEIDQNANIQKYTDNEELSINHIFSENKYVKFTMFCYKNRIKNILEITHDDLMDFKFSYNIERETLMEITNIINRYDNEYSKNNYKSEVEGIKSQIEGKLNKLTYNQRRVGIYICENLDKIPDFQNIDELSQKIGVSSLLLSTTLIKLKLGNFQKFKKKILDLL